MRRKAVVLAVFCLLVFAGGAHAVTLQQGWYANMNLVDVYFYGPLWEDRMTSAWFPTPTGTYWPFLVTDAGGSWRRYASVPETAYGVTPDQSLVLPIYIPLGTGTRIACLHLSASTNYDPAAMYLTLWHDHPGVSHTLLWEQKLGGQRIWAGDVPFDSTFDNGQTYFKVQVVPEPSALVCLLAGVGCLLRARRRR